MDEDKLVELIEDEKRRFAETKEVMNIFVKYMEETSKTLAMIYQKLEDIDNHIKEVKCRDNNFKNGRR